jgi:hypothetical protein
MRSASYRLIRMAIKMASKVGDFFLPSILCHVQSIQLLHLKSIIIFLSSLFMKHSLRISWMNILCEFP